MEPPIRHVPYADWALALTAELMFVLLLFLMKLLARKLMPQMEKTIPRNQPIQERGSVHSIHILILGQRTLINRFYEGIWE
jgi:hypothetical protein